jgi:rubrerythrin
MKYMSGEIEKEILKILEEAIHREQAANRLYSKGAALAGKSELKDIFVMLAKEELGHEKMLKQIYHDYKKQLGLKVLKEDGK